MPLRSGIEDRAAVLCAALALAALQVSPWLALPAAVLLSGVIQLLLQGSRRIEVIETIQESPFLRFRVMPLPELEDTSSEVEALQRTMLDLATRLLALGPPQIQIDLQRMVTELERPVQQAYVLSSLTSIDTDRQYRLLAASSQREVLSLVVDYLNHEVQVLEVQDQISKAVASIRRAPSRASACRMRGARSGTCCRTASSRTHSTRRSTRN